ncbi:hypothetical protein LTSEINV_1395 [Salmonella enterica subsp. enterica serovar Inverness str. R8-3668]|uniref:Uncharacterized protein n=1 Tax=Salmonella enterica subsp. enterica serovar Inverness str. R8-3668 TaxID=913075 RepID=G5NAB9_SALET|nr:hypothetical protein LTSEINV_1395 [Salmonella enterica subsp. enterica serovar Inverness str. R8-3668]
MGGHQPLRVLSGSQGHYGAAASQDFTPYENFPFQDFTPYENF